jgi:hypothetical protein
MKRSDTLAIEENQPQREYYNGSTLPVKSKCLLLFAKEIIVVKKHNNLNLGMVKPSTG